MTLTGLRALPASDPVDCQKDTLISLLNPVVDGFLIPDNIRRIFCDSQQPLVPYLAGPTSWEASLLRCLSPPAPRAVLSKVDNLDCASGIFGNLDNADMAKACFVDSIFLGIAYCLTSANDL